MSVSLGITWKGGRFEDYALAPQASLETRLVPLALRLGLKHVPHIYTFYAIDAANLNEVIGELKALEAAAKPMYPEWLALFQNVERIIAALERLNGQEGWRASFG